MNNEKIYTDLRIMEFGRAIEKGIMPDYIENLFPARFRIRNALRLYYDILIMKANELDFRLKYRDCYYIENGAEPIIIRYFRNKKYLGVKLKPVDPPKIWCDIITR